MKNILEVKDLKVSYHSYAGEVKSVRGVSFSVGEGESVAIVGESGCGKSVTAKTIMGLIQTPPGEIKEGSQILFDGKNILDRVSGCAGSIKSYADHRTADRGKASDPYGYEKGGGLCGGRTSVNPCGDPESCKAPEAVSP